MGKFGKIPTEKKVIKIAVIEAVSQQIMEETSRMLREAGIKLLVSLMEEVRNGPQPV